MTRLRVTLLTPTIGGLIEDVDLSVPLDDDTIAEIRSALLNRRVITKVSTGGQIGEILKKTEQSKRVLEDASEGFALSVVREDESGDETITIEKLTADEFVNTNPSVAGGRGSASNYYKRVK